EGGEALARFVAPAGATPAAAGPGGGGRGGPGGDNHAMWIDPKDPKFMLSGNDSGFRVTTDGGATWKRADLPTSTYFDIAYDMDKPFRVYGSVQDHGSYRAPIDLSNGAGGLQPVAWGKARGGEYAEHGIDPTTPTFVYCAGPPGTAPRRDSGFPAARGGRGGGAGGCVPPKPEAPPLRTTCIRPPT